MGPVRAVTESPADALPQGSGDHTSLLYVIKQVEMVSRAHLDALLRPTGVTALQFTALSVLAQRPTMAQADLARMSFTRAQSAADLVAALERHGFISRAPDPANRRRKVISLTDAGRDFLTAHRSEVAEIEARMLRELDAGERADFARALRACRNALAELPLS